MQACGRCYGTKRIVGIGGMDVTCPDCNGSGKQREQLKAEEKAAVIKRPRKKKDAA